jgi:hypothetical protein
MSNSSISKETKVMSQSTMDSYSPRPYDILCGRNRNAFNNIGNRRFRITVSMNVEKYGSLRSRYERSKFIASLAQTMKYEAGFRFLKRKGGQQIELSDEEIRAKIGHAIRDLSTALRQNASTQDADSRVPRPLPYKIQDKEQIETFKPTPMPTPAPQLSSLLPLQTGDVVETTNDNERDESKIPASIFSGTKLSEILSEEELFPLEIGEAYRSLISPVDMDLLPSFDEDEDMTPEEPSSMVQHVTALGAVGAGDEDEVNCDTSLPSSCCLSDALEILSLADSLPGQ